MKKEYIGLNAFKSTIFWLQRAEVTGQWKKLPNNELEDVYASPDII